MYSKCIFRLPLRYLERAVVSLQLSAEALQFAASQDRLAVLVPQVVFLLDHLVLLLLQHAHLLLGVAVLFQLSHTHTHTQTNTRRIHLVLL